MDGIYAPAVGQVFLNLLMLGYGRGRARELAVDFGARFGGTPVTDESMIEVAEWWYRVRADGPILP